MIGTRFEEYGRTSDELPFVLHARLKRTAESLSRESNWHGELEIQLCLDGEGSVLLDGNSINIKKDDIITVNSNVIHYTSTESRLEYLCLIISTSFCRQNGIDTSKLLYDSLIHSELLLEYFKELTDIYGSDSPIRTAKLNHTVLKILIELTEKHSQINDLSESTSKAFENVKATIRYIREHYAEKFTLDDISKSIYADKFELCRSFKRLSNLTIVQYTNAFRCQRAAELIAEGHSVNDAAWLCGFHNTSFFTKTFKQYMGRLPSEYK
ncbi:MAG: helix-turn-helix transcriptional regulator [Clostridia bacterium]|nr:helix-turn-helix transcriptional regulator [Clostridia bacterium]